MTKEDTVKHTKIEWLRAAKELRDKYTRESFDREYIRIGYQDPHSCSFCQLSENPKGNGLECCKCIYYLAPKEKFKKRKPYLYRLNHCLAIGPIVPEYDSNYAVVARRRTWLDRRFIPWLKSLPAKHEFFAQDKETA